MNESEIESLPFYDNESKDSIKHILDKLKKSEFWENLLDIHSQESSHSNEPFNARMASLLSSLVNQFEDRFLYSGLAPTVEKLVSFYSDASKQRAVAEVMAGILKGMKHWSEKKSNRLWAWALPLVSSALQAATPESLSYWTEFVNIATVFDTFYCIIK